MGRQHGRKARATAIAPKKFVSKMSRSTRVSPVAIGADAEMPALLITTVVSAAMAAARATNSWSVTSSTSGSTRGSSQRRGERAVAYTLTAPRCRT